MIDPLCMFADDCNAFDTTNVLCLTSSAWKHWTNKALQMCKCLSFSLQAINLEPWGNTVMLQHVCAMKVRNFWRTLKRQCTLSENTACVQSEFSSWVMQRGSAGLKNCIIEDFSFVFLYKIPKRMVLKKDQMQLCRLCSSGGACF